MNIQPFKMTGVLRFDELNSLLLPEPELGVGGFGTKSIFKTKDRYCVAVTPYGTVIRFCHRKATPSPKQVAQELELECDAYIANSGGLFPTAQQKRAFRGDIVRRLTAQTVPTDTDIYVYVFNNYLLVGTTSSSDTQSILRAIESCGAPTVPAVAGYNATHKTVMAGMVDNFHAEPSFHMRDSSGCTLAIGNTTVNSNIIQPHLDKGFVYEGCKFVSELGQFELRPTSYRSCALAKPVAVQLAAESAESPEVFEATHAAAIMAMMILPIDELAKLNTDSAS